MSRYMKKVGEEDETDKFLQKNLTNPGREGYVEIGEDKTLMPIYYQFFAHKIKNLDIRDDDVFVASFPRTGTTWTQEMVWLIANNLDFERAKIGLDQRFPYLEFSTTTNFDNLPPINNPAANKFRIDSVGFVQNMPSPRFIKTHLPWSLLPDQIQGYIKRPKIIYVARNAQDTCVSYYHFHKSMSFKPPFNEFCQAFINGRIMYGPFWPNVLGYWEQMDQPNVLFIKYEEMQKNLREVIKQVAAFLKKELTNEQINQLQEHLQIENMKSNKAVNPDFGLKNFIRNGVVGGYKSEMSKDMMDKFYVWSKFNTFGTKLTL